MNPRKLATALAVATAAALSASASGLADSPASDAAQTCAQGPQIDYYQVIGATEDAAPPELDFGNLAHGSDETGTYVIALNEGDCVNFIAKNTKGKSSSTNGQEFFKVELKQIVITRSPF